MRWFLCAVLVFAGCKKSPEPIAAPPPVEVTAGPAPFWKWVAANV